MPEDLSKTHKLSQPNWFNWICAHPTWICCFIGALIIDLVLLSFVFSQVSIPIILEDWWNLMLIFWGLLIFAGLGSVVGIMALYFPVMDFCCWVNGAPHAIGDSVLILTGPKKAQITKIYKISQNQGGGGSWIIAHLDLGEDAKRTFGDIFELPALFNMRDQAVRINPLHID